MLRDTFINSHTHTHTHTHTHSVVLGASEAGCERQGEIRRQAFSPLLSLFLRLSPSSSPSYLSPYVCLPLSLRGVCLYLTFLPSACLPFTALYISNCPFVFLSQLIQSFHSCVLKWWCVMSLFPFKLSPRDNVRWEGCGDEMNATKVFHISDTHPERETLVCVCSCYSSPAM